MGDIYKWTGTQDLSAGALALTHVFPKGETWNLRAVLVHASASITETVTVTLDSNDGANYDTVIRTADLAAETDFAWICDGQGFPISSQGSEGDGIKVAVTNANTTGTVYATIIAEKVSG